MVHLHTKFHESMFNRTSSRVINVSSIGVLKQRNKEIKKQRNKLGEN